MLGHTQKVNMVIQLKIHIAGILNQLKKDNTFYIKMRLINLVDHYQYIIDSLNELEE